MKRLALVALATIGALSAGCHRQRLSKENPASLVQTSAAFQHPMVAYLPRVLAIPADGTDSASAASREGAALSLIQMAAVDPVVAVFRARGQVEIEDFVSAVPSSVVIPTKPDSTKADSAKAKKDSTKTDSTKSDSTKKDSASAAPKPDTIKPKPPPPRNTLNQPQMSPPPVAPFAHAWVHTLRMTPRASFETGDLTVDEGDDDENAPRPVYNGRAIGRTPGWAVSVGTREFIKVLGVADRGTIRDDVPGDLVVDFLWRWQPTRSGALFDLSGAPFQSLPSEVQKAAQDGGLAFDTSSPHWSRAIVARTGAGWRVSKIDWSYGDGKEYAP